MVFDPGHETPEAGRVRSNLDTARDLYALRQDPSARVEWAASEHAWDGDTPYDGPLWDAALYVGGDYQCSLGGIAEPDTTTGYCSVVEAELYGEHRCQASRRTAGAGMAAQGAGGGYGR